MEERSSGGEGQRDASACRSSGARFGLSKEDRILRSSDFRKIIREGRRYRTPHFHIRVLRNSLGRARLGITAGRKVGTACARNAIKRRLREFFRLNRDKIPADTDVVFIVLKGAAGLNTRQIFLELGRFFEEDL